MSDIDISEPLSDMLAPLNNEQKEFLMNNYTIQTYKKNETLRFAATWMDCGALC